MSYNMVNVGPLTAEIGYEVCGTPANFNGLHVLASLLHRRRSTEVNQTLQDIWPSPELVHHLYVWGGFLPPNGISLGANFTLRPSVAFFYIGPLEPHSIMLSRSQTCSELEFDLSRTM